MTDKIPERPFNYREPAFVPDADVRWNPALSRVIVENDQVMGVACGYMKPTDLQSGDVYYKLVDAVFINEPAARGRHVINVDVIDKDGRRVQGARVWHGWPTGNLPNYDDRVQATIFGGQIAEWALYEEFDAWKDPGPYWVQPADGKADIFWGAGLPWRRHVCFSLVFQQTVYQAGSGDPGPDPVEPPITGTLAETLLAAAQAAQVIQFNPDAALQKAIFMAEFVPNSPEFTVRWNDRAFVGQRAEHLKSGEVRVFYCERGDWNNVFYVVRP